MKSADQSTTVLTHHLGNQLSATQAYLELFLSGALDAEQSRRLAANLFDLTKHTSVSLTNFSLWSKKEALTTRSARPELQAALTQALEDQRSIASNKGVNLVLLPSPACKVVADPLHLQLILRNLLDNALKFTPTGGSVTLSVELASGQALVHVRDTGIGMGKSIYGTRNEKGLGLGLKLCEHLAKLQGISLSWASEAGNGTAVTVALALA
jgi:two-component system sensor histidine kinase/response regulator